MGKLIGVVPGVMCCFTALVAWAQDEATPNGMDSFLVNGGFEEVTQAPGVGHDGGTHNGWMLKGGPHVPSEWALSSHFTGELAMASEGAPEGKRFLRLKGGPEREAHVHQACPGLQPDDYYMLSIQYRGGPVMIKAYEYIVADKAPRLATIATGEATALDGGWHTVEGSYFAPEVGNVRIAVAVGTGCTADLDDVRVRMVHLESGPHDGHWLNVRDFGASGSDVETTAATTAGSGTITLADAGDFEVGQWVSVSKCHIRYDRATLYGTGSPYAGGRPLGDTMEIRGYDGSQGSWLIYILEIESSDPVTCRWSDALLQGYKWNATRVPVTWDWQTLSNGIEVKLNKRDLQPGHMIVFEARDQLVTRIEATEGNTLTLRDKANRTVQDAVVRHSDSETLQTAIDVAVRQRRNLYVPNGHYRLTGGLAVRHANIRIEGENGVNTVMDISAGRGAVFRLRGGTEVTLRNFSAIGHTGIAEKPGSFTTSSGYSYWCCALKSCQAVVINGTERVLVENMHATRMSAEAFYCQGPRRIGQTEPQAYTKSLTFLRCSVTDCAANAFNNNDMSENTCVLYCRIDGAGWHAYEGPARFIKLIGNYVRNAGPFTIGDCTSRPEYLKELGCGQAVVADNVFEGSDGRNGGIHLGHGPRQVTIANNLFVNYNGTAITVSGHCARQDNRVSLPARNAVVKGNIIDLTYQGEKPKSRWGIQVSASDVTVADNQIYVRGDNTAPAHGIRISEPARNVIVHDNLIRNCRHGIQTSRGTSTIRKVIDARTFLETGLPMVWWDAHCYRGWDLIWTSGANNNQISRIDSYDPTTTAFTLTEPHDLRAGDHVEIIPADGANWNLHDNTITGCTQPVVFDSYGSATSLLRNNIITRAEAEDVREAIAVAGRLSIIGNHVVGFDEEGCAALLLSPDKAGRTYRHVIAGNTFDGCTTVVRESAPGLWDGALRNGNTFLDCGGAETAGAALPSEQTITAVLVAPPQKPEFAAPRLKAEVKLDGNVSEWPWADKARVALLRHGPGGDPVPSPRGYACAAHDGDSLYLAMRFELPKGATLKAEGGFDRGDGIELSFQNANPKHPTSILLLWGSVGGMHEASPAMGASADDVERIRKGSSYAAAKTDTGWSCEWHIPFSAMGLKAGNVDTLFFNLGLQCTANGSWIVWTPTGGRVCDVANAGALRLR